MFFKSGAPALFTQLKHVLSFVLSVALITTLLQVFPQPQSAQAAYEGYVNLELNKSYNADTNQVDIEAKLPSGVELTHYYNGKLSLYKNNDPTPVASITSGNVLNFSASKPDSGVDVYEARLETQWSREGTSRAVVVSSDTNGWGVDLISNSSTYSLGQESVLTWTTTQNVSSQTQYGLFFVDEVTGNILHKTNSGETGEFSFGDTTFYNRNFVRITAYIAAWDSEATTLASLQDIQTRSDTVKLVQSKLSLQMTATPTSNEGEFELKVETPTSIADANQSAGSSLYSLYVYKSRAYEGGGSVELLTSSDVMNTSFSTLVVPDPAEETTYFAEIRATQLNHNPSYSNGYAEDSWGTAQYLIQSKYQSLWLSGQTSFTAGDYSDLYINYSFNHGEGLPNHSLYLVEEASGNIIPAIQGFYPGQTAGFTTVPRWYTGETKSFKVYQAAWDSTATNLTQLLDLQATSRSLKISQLAWSVTISGEKTNAGSNDYKITMRSNQLVNPQTGSPVNSVYLANSQTGQILDRFQGNNYSNDLWLSNSDTNLAEVKAYVADYSETLPNNISELTNIKHQSNNLVLNEVPEVPTETPSLYLSVYPESFNTNSQTPYLQWSVPTPVFEGSEYGIYVVQMNNGKIIHAEQSSYGYIPVERFYTENSIQYKVVLATWDEAITTESEIQNVVASSLPVEARREGWTVDLQLDNQSLSFTTNQPTYDSYLNDSTYSVYIYDETDQKLLTENVSPSYTNSYYPEIVSNVRTHTFKAVVAASEQSLDTKLNSLNSIQAESNTVEITSDEKLVSLSASANSYSTTDSLPELSVSTTVPLKFPESEDFKDAMYLFDDTTGKLLGTNVSDFTVPIERFHSGGAHQYRVYIASYGQIDITPSTITGVSAVSDPVYVERANWSVTVEDFTATEDEHPKLYVTTNQQYSGLTADETYYKVYLYDVASDTYLGSTPVNYSDGPGSFSYTADTIPVDGSREIVAFVAKSVSTPPASYSGLEDVQTQSAPVIVAARPWVATLTTNSDTLTNGRTSPMLTGVTSRLLDQDGVSGPEYAMYFIESGTGTIVGRSTSSTNKTFSYSVPRFYDDPSRTYKIVVAQNNPMHSGNFSGLTNVKAISSDVTIYRDTWNVSLTKVPEQPTDQNNVVSLSWNQPLTDTENYNRWSLYLFNETLNTLVYQNSSKDITSTQEVEVPADTSYQYKAYIARSSNNVSGISSLNDIQAESESLTVTGFGWDTTSTVTTSEFATNSATPEITVQTRRNLNFQSTPGQDYAAYLFDETTDSFVGSSISTGKSFTIPVKRFYTGGPHSYKVYVAKYGTNLPTSVTSLQSIQSVSNSVTISRSLWTASLSQNTHQPNEDHPIITMSANQPAGRASDDKYWAYLVDESNGEIIHSTDLSNTSATVEVAPPAGTTKSYRMYVAKFGSFNNFSQLTDIQATSNTLEVSGTNWELNLNVNENTFKTDELKSKLSVTSNKATNRTATAEQDYAFYFVDDTTGRVLAGKYGDASTKTFGDVYIRPFESGGPHSYSVYVGDYTSGLGWGAPPVNVNDIPNVQGKSNSVTVSRAPWTISIDEVNEYYEVGSYVLAKTQLNQTLLNNKTYFIYFADVNTGALNQRQSLSKTGDATVIRTTSTTETSEYRAYVAEAPPAGAPEYTNVSQLTDIQAVSAETVKYKNKPWSVTLASVYCGSGTTSGGGGYNQTPYMAKEDNGGLYTWYIVDMVTKEVKNHDFTNLSGSNTDTYHANGFSFSGEACDPTHPHKTFIADMPWHEDADGRRYYDPHTSSTDFIKILASSNPVMPEVYHSGPQNAGEVEGGSNPSVACNNGCAGDPINTANGEFYENATDLDVNSLIPFSLTRSYSANRADELGSLGYGWRSGFDMKLTDAETSQSANLTSSAKLALVQENGSITEFTNLGNNKYQAPDRVFADLELNSATNEYEFTRTNGFKFYFSAATGKLLKIEDRNNNSLALSYNNSEELAQVVSNNGQVMVFIWDDGVIQTAASNNGETVVYSYNANKELVSVDVSGADNNFEYEYDSTHRIVKLINLSGGETTNVYDSSNRVATQTNPEGNVLSFEYVESGIPSNRFNTTFITYPDGSVTKEVYNSTYQLVSETKAYGTPLAAETTHSYGLTNQKIKSVDPEGNIISYTYDENGNATSVSTATGTSYNTFDNYNQLTSTTDALGNTSTMEYDSKGNLLRTVSPSGKVSTLTYNSDGTVATTQDPNQYGTSQVESYAYSANRFLTSTTDYLGNSNALNLNSNGLLSSSEDNAGNETLYNYDSFNRSTGTIYPNGATTSTTYEDSGQVATSTDTGGRVTSYEYNASGLVTAVTTIVGTTSYDYDSRNRVVKVTDPTGKEVSVTYDAAGNRSSQTDAMGNTSYFSYYKNGLVKTVTDPMNQTTSFFYDSNGKPIKTVDAMGSSSSVEYDAAGRTVKTVDAMGKSNSYIYDVDSQLVSEIRSDGSQISYEYDSNGNLLKRTNSSGDIETYTYDANNNQLTFTNALGQVESYEYDSLNQMTRKTRVDGTTEEYSYDSMGNPVETSFGLLSSDNITSSYDIEGKLLSTLKGGVETTYAYDAIGNLTYRGPPTSGGVNYSYNASQQISNILYPNGRNVGYSYNDNGSITAVTVDGVTQASYSYNSNSLPTSVDYANGVEESWDYDALNRTTSQDITKNQNGLYSKELTLNKIGFITKSTTDDSSAITDKTFDYDALNRVSSVTTGLTVSNYAFDPQTNLVSTNSSSNTHNKLGQLLSSEKLSDGSTTNYGYNLIGNRTSATTTDSNETLLNSTAYSWSDDNSLSKVQLDGKTLNYSYDDAGLLTSKDKTEDDLTETSSFVWDTTSSIPTLLEDSKFDYIYGLNSAPIAQIEKTTGEMTYLHSDYSRSIVLTTDESGNRVSSYEYDAYGNQTGGFGDASHEATAFGYTGEYKDEDTGLYYLRARWYEPSNGVFLSLDPLYQSTHEGYAYAAGNPVMLSDPLGLDPNPYFDYKGSDGVTNFNNWIAGFGDNASSIAGIPSWLIYGGFSRGEPLTKSSPTYLIRELFNGNTSVDECSTFYKWGGIGGLFGSLVLGGLGSGATKAGAEGATFTAGTKVLTTVPEGMTRVGRWMSKAEYDKMINTGKLQESTLGGGFTKFAHPANPTAYKNPGPGDIYVEFNVPSINILPGGAPGWGMIAGPSSYAGRLGKPGTVSEFPIVTDIKWIK